MSANQYVYVGGGSTPVSSLVGPERPPTDMADLVPPEPGEDFVVEFIGGVPLVVEVGAGRLPTGNRGQALVDSAGTQAGSFFFSQSAAVFFG